MRNKLKLFDEKKHDDWFKGDELSKVERNFFQLKTWVNLIWLN